MYALTDNRMVVARGEGGERRMKQLKGVKYMVAEADFGL